MSEPKDWIACNKCDKGHICLGEHIVTRDMAIDAGDPSMEGMSMGFEWAACDCCGGPGWEHCERCTLEAETEEP